MDRTDVHVRFFCARKEVSLLTNRAFSLKSDKDKQKKLKVTLRKRTGNALSAKEMQAITRRIIRDRQYSIHVYHDPVAFEKALVLVRNGVRYDYGEVILGKAWFGVSGIGGSEDGQLFTVHHSAAAQIVRYSENRAERYALHIYIPTQRKQEGCKHEKRR